MSHPTSSYILQPTHSPRWWRWIALGLVAAIAAWVVLVALASTKASSASDGSATAGVLGLDMVSVTRSRSAEGSSVSLSTDRGAAALLVLPLVGAAIGLARRRSAPEPVEQQ